MPVPAPPTPVLADVPEPGLILGLGGVGGSGGNAAESETPGMLKAMGYLPN